LEKIAAMPMAVTNQKSMLLDDGRIFLYEGRTKKTLSGYRLFYDPHTKEFQEAPQPLCPRESASYTKLKDGKVLIAGDISNPKCQQFAEVFDPATNRYRRVGNMKFPRRGHSAFLLNNGKVLILGGRNDNNVVGIGNGREIFESELYNPKTEQFEITSSISKESKIIASIQGVSISNNRILIVYNNEVNNMNNNASGMVKNSGDAKALIYHIDTGLWTKAGAFTDIGDLTHITFQDKNNIIFFTSSCSGASQIFVYNPDTHLIKLKANLSSMMVQHIVPLGNEKVFFSSSKPRLFHEKIDYWKVKYCTLGIYDFKSNKPLIIGHSRAAGSGCGVSPLFAQNNILLTGGYSMVALPTKDAEIFHLGNKNI